MGSAVHVAACEDALCPMWVYLVIQVSMIAEVSSGRVEIADLSCNKFTNLLNSCHHLRADTLLQNPTHEFTTQEVSDILIPSVTVIKSVNISRLKQGKCDDGGLQCDHIIDALS